VPDGLVAEEPDDEASAGEIVVPTVD
jgi:hypothetical protein